MKKSFELHVPEVLLADDDMDDCLLFRDALSEAHLAANLTTVRDGQQLMEYLNKSERLPDVLFLDFNMPRKNGYECLIEIRQSVRLKILPVIIISTSLEPNLMELLYEKGAQYYLCKPNNYFDLVNGVRQVIKMILPQAQREQLTQPTRDKFLLSTGIVMK
jgi:CheY-like chemotaxis protein